MRLLALTALIFGAVFSGSSAAILVIRIAIRTAAGDLPISTDTTVLMVMLAATALCSAITITITTSRKGTP